mgnify:CR=1 FL=1
MAPRMGWPDRLLNYRCPPWLLAHALIRVWFADLLVYAPIVTVRSQSGSRLANYRPDVGLLAPGFWRVRGFANSLCSSVWTTGSYILVRYHSGIRYFV